MILTDSPSAHLAEPELDEVAAVIRSLYQCLGNRPAFDAHLADDITMWESDAQGLLRGLGALDELRDARAARGAAGSGPALAAVGPEEVVVDRWGDVAVARCILRVEFAEDGVADETFRVTDVLVRGAGAAWRIQHHHAEKYTG